MSTTLKELVNWGRHFLSVVGKPAGQIRHEFMSWDDAAAQWISDHLEPQHAAAWSALSQPLHVPSSEYRTDLGGVSDSIEEAARERMDWLSKFGAIRVVSNSAPSGVSPV